MSLARTPGLAWADAVEIATDEPGSGYGDFLLTNPR